MARLSLVTDSPVQEAQFEPTSPNPARYHREGLDRGRLDHLASLTCPGAQPTVALEQADLRSRAHVRAGVQVAFGP